MNRFIEGGFRVTAAVMLASCSASRVQPTSDPREVDRQLPVCQFTPGISSEFCLTQFQVEPTTDENLLAIKVCSTGRPLNSTIRVRVSKEPIDSTSSQVILEEDSAQVILGEDDYSVIKEFSGPCFDTNESNPDHPEWHTDNLQSGYYIIETQVRPEEANGIWDDPSVITYFVSYYLE